MDASASEMESATAHMPEAPKESGTAFVTALEEQIERSKSHWSELAEPTEVLSREEAATIKLENEEVFEAWRSHREWGFFFMKWDDFDELKVGEKFAEGAQAELFDVHVRWRNPKSNKRDVERGWKWVVKVFKEGTLLRHLERQWPHGIFQYNAAIEHRVVLGKSLWNRHRSDVCSAILLEDGRFAFLIRKEDEDLRSLIDRKMLECCRGGSGPFSRVDVEDYMCEVALGVDQLHRYNIVHRDLKASNVLVKTNVYGYISCYVSDYECSIGVVGTRWWRAPEILRACKEGNVREKPELFSKGADIYSLGMTFYEILTGKHPFEDEVVTRDGVIDGQRPHVPGFVDEWARQLMHRCWEPNCGARPSIGDILRELEAKSSSEHSKWVFEEREKLLGEENTSTTNDDGPLPT